MSVIYGNFKSQTVDSDATQDLWNLIGTTTNRLRLLGFEVTSDTLTAELVALTLTRVTDSGTGGNAVTEERADENDGAPTGVMLTEVTTPGTPSGELMSFEWEQLGPVGHVWIPEMRPICEFSEGFALVVSTAVAFNASGWVCWEEI